MLAAYTQELEEMNLSCAIVKSEEQTINKMKKNCASTSCRLPSLTVCDGRIEIKAVIPAKRADMKNMCVRWKRNGEAAFHTECWSGVLKMARSRAKNTKRGTGTQVEGHAHFMKQAEKLMIVNAAKTLEKFDSMESIKAAAETAAKLILKSRHSIAFTGAGISTSAGLGDFRGKSGKWTEQDQSRMDSVIKAALQREGPRDRTAPPTVEGSSSTLGKRTRENQSKVPLKQESPSDSSQGQPSVELPSSSNEEPPAKKHKKGSAPTVKEEPADETNIKEEEDDEEESDEYVDYENLRPTYTHEALALLMDKGHLGYLVSQNCDGLHLLSGVPQDRISELHGNVFVEKCPHCDTRYARDFYVLNDQASQYYEELEDCGQAEVSKPKFATQCDMCGLCHRTGRRCEQKGCTAYLEDTIINFRDHLEETGLDRALEEAGQSEVILCLGTTLMVTPACDIVEEAKGSKPLIICNRQKTAKDHLAGIRVFGDCDVFISEVMTHLLDTQERREWEEKRGERMKQYNVKRQTPSASHK